MEIKIITSHDKGSAKAIKNISLDTNKRALDMKCSLEAKESINNQLSLLYS